MNRLKHISGLLGIVAAQLGLVWADQQTDLVGKICLSIVALLTILWTDSTKQEKAVVAVRGGVALGAVVLTMVLTKCSLEAGTTAVVTTIAAVFVRLPAMLANMPKPTGASEDKTVRLQPPGPPTAAVLVLIAGLALQSCSSGPDVKPDQFFGAVVDCAQVNPQSSAALAAVTTCLIGAATQNHGVCLGGLVTGGTWTITEVACVTAFVAQQRNDAIASGGGSNDDVMIRTRANEWLKVEKIGIRNTYQSR
jgi:hypothetical protein